MNRKMPLPLFLAPCGDRVGLTTLSLGLIRALDARGVRVAFFKPIGQSYPQGVKERSTHFIGATTQLRTVEPISQNEAQRCISAGDEEHLLEQVVERYQEACGDADLVVVEGLVHTPEWSAASALNVTLARTLSAQVVLAARVRSGDVDRLAARLELGAREFGGIERGPVIGALINRVPTEFGGSLEEMRETLAAKHPFFSRADFAILGAVPENPELGAPRTLDIARYLGASVLSEGEMATRRVRDFSLLARTVPNMLDSFKPGSILVTPADRADVVVAVAMAAVNQVRFAGLVLTGDTELPEGIFDLCRPGWETGLPVLKVATNSWQTATHLSAMNPEMTMDDIDRVRRSMDHVAAWVDADGLARRAAAPMEARLSPAAFCHRLVEQAKQADRRIVLPEGEEPRTLRAAEICARRGIARCVLLGNREEILRVAQGLEIDLPAGVEIVDPAEVRERYVAPLVELRKHKGLSAHDAADFLEDRVWLGTVMLALGEVDGLVSGAVHTSANTIRPALQIIKTKPDARVVSSIFFMCLPEQVYVYGDCAVNPDPDAETLADIAIQSADSAAEFGLSPRVAMISYSTGESGHGVEVDKVREATRIARAKRPDLLLDGPLQYDAAAIADVAATKAPDSPIAGRANVFIFPDLNTGNTTYKAVQRSANVISIGPVLQGLNRPVNDLSRGALVDDIVYTIAITALQARGAGALGLK